MRPTITEQLEGTCAVLERVVAPEVAGTPAAEVLRGLVRNLRTLGESWTADLPFQHWDIRETGALLERLSAVVPGPLAQRIASVGLDPDPIDAVAVDTRAIELRGLLSEAVRVMDTDTPEHAAVVAHLTERTRRYPLRMVPDTPRSAG
ncbi:hypothetical protein [Pseudonocardia sp. NPDC049154]|uniref:hypothetical protein n=1 Tax=Pseudonocardia sp. NPDC049154 TaxID=3155501 RepID=UPI00340096D4